MNRGLFIALFLVFFLYSNVFAQIPQNAKIGVLSFNSLYDISEEWSYIKRSASKTNITIEVIPLSAAKLEEAIRKKHIDFVITNPFRAIYYQLAYGVSSPLLTIARSINDQTVRSFGATIFTRADNDHINELADLEDKKLAAPFEGAFGFYAIQNLQSQLGLPLLEEEQMLFTGMPHSKMVEAVLKGDADAGFARAGTLEKLTARGNIDIKQFKVINQQKTTIFPYKISTELYPEWPLAALPHVSLEKQSQVIISLLGLPKPVPGISVTNTLWLSPPADYSHVETMMRNLKVPPFDHVAPLTFSELWNLYRWSISVGGIVLLTFIMMLFYLYISRRQVQLSQRELGKQVDIFQKLTDSAKDAIIQIDEQGKVTFWNPAAENIFGYSKSEMAGVNLHEQLVPENLLTIHKEKFPKYLQTGTGKAVGKTLELEGVHKDGHPISCELTLSTFVADNKRQSMAIVRDVSERKQIEAKIKRFSRVLEQSLNEIYMFDADTLKFVDVNLGARKNLGYSLEEMRQLTPVDIKPEITPENFDEIIAPLREGLKQLIVFNTKHQRKDGSHYPVEVHLQLLPEQPPLFVAIILDISERKQEEARRLELEEQLRQKYKMEAVGVLAGGMAHNFNNNLAIILGNLELAELKSDSPKAMKEHLNYSKTALLRSRDLIKQILIYSRQEEHQKETVNVSEIMKETLKLLYSTIPTTVDLQCNVSPEAESITIFADATQVQEILINLCTNALHAMSEKGEISISLAKFLVEQEDIPAHYKATAGEYLQIRVQDNGCGISQENIEKIFDPFFTTKPVDEGTGMGLSTVRSIIEQHEGFIKVHSVPSEGTVFELYFPVQLAGRVDAPTKREKLEPGSGSILFVDDDEMLADMGLSMLTEMGYQATSTTNALQALEKIKQNPQAFDLVITDQTMPGMTGKELARQIKKVRADLPIILCTGYSSQVSARDAEQSGISSFCMKPLSITELSKTIKDCLGNCST
jgi:PAS domain S-box-containing protein